MRRFVVGLVLVAHLSCAGVRGREVERSADPDIRAMSTTQLLRSGTRYDFWTSGFGAGAAASLVAGSVFGAIYIASDSPPDGAREAALLGVVGGIAAAIVASFTAASAEHRWNELEWREQNPGWVQTSTTAD